MPELVADWPLGTTRYFACDLLNGNDGADGFSDVSLLDSRNHAVKTLDVFTRQVIPKFGAGRLGRAAVLAGNYASDTILDLSGCSGYKQLDICATADVPSAGASAFTGDANDFIAAGMSIADGTSPDGYNVTSYVGTGDGTVIVTLQKNGGGAPGFGAMPARPYGCRIRFGSGTATPELANKCSGVTFLVNSDTIEIALGVPAVPTLADVCYFDAPAVTGPTTTIMNHFGGDGTGNPDTQLLGLQLGFVQMNHSRVRFAGCEATGFNATDSSIIAGESALDIPSTFRTIGTGLRYRSINARGGSWNLTSCMGMNLLTSVFFQPGSFVWERSSSGAQLILYGGGHAVGNTIIDAVGTHLSTNHGAACRIWGNVAPPQGTKQCGLWLGGGYRTGRIKFSNMGANPCVRQNGTGMASTMSNQIQGSAADGNLDVGLDLSPNGRVGDTAGAMGCTIALESLPTVTGTNGDVRLPDGTIVTWAQAMAGLTDGKGNRFIS
jgi:hypothetical protein